MYVHRGCRHWLPDFFHTLQQAPTHGFRNLMNNLFETVKKTQRWCSHMSFQLNKSFSLSLNLRRGAMMLHETDAKAHEAEGSKKGSQI